MERSVLLIVVLVLEAYRQVKGHQVLYLKSGQFIVYLGLWCGRKKGQGKGGGRGEHLAVSVALPSIRDLLPQTDLEPFVRRLARVSATHLSH